MLKYLNMNKKLIPIVFLIIILAIAVFFRLWKLDSIPPGLYPDVAVNGNNALDSMANNDFKIFYTDNNGREGLIIWLEALTFKIFGISIWSLKATAAIFGILAVLGLYLLVKELFKSEIIALLASFFMAISSWHVIFSRIGFRAIMIPFFLTFGFYFLFKGFRKHSVLSVIISGIFIGLGFYTYISYRFVVLMLLAVLIGFWYKDRKEFVKLTSILLITTFIVGLPIGIYFLQNPQDFFGRAAGVSVLTAKNPLVQLGESIVLNFGMFNFYGDSNWRHNLSGSPELLWPVGILFIIGIIISLKGLIKRKDMALHIFLVVWFLSMLLPGILSAEGVPHALRVIGVIPVAFIFAGQGASWIYDWLKRLKVQTAILYLCIFVFLLSLTSAEFKKYFYTWGKNPELNGAFTSDLVDIGNYLNSLPDNVKKYVVVNQSGVLVNGVSMPAQTPMFIERTIYGKPRATYLLPSDLNKVELNKGDVIVLMARDETLFPSIQNIDGVWVYIK